MGLRATVIKKYEIEYGETQGFNYGASALAGIIYEYCNDYYVGEYGYGACDSDAIWEVDKDEFAGMLDEIKLLSDEEFKEQFSDVEQDREEVIRIFEGFLRETPENSLYVRWGWL